MHEAEKPWVGRMLESVHPIPHDISGGYPPEEYFCVPLLTWLPLLLRQPDRGMILHYERDLLKTVLRQQRAILLRIQAPVIERLALEIPQHPATLGTAGEHQGRSWSCMPPKHRKHRRLILGSEVEKAMPRKNAVKPPPQLQRPHIAEEPLLLRKSPTRHLQQRLRRIHTGHPVSLPDEIAADRQPRPAADIENRRRSPAFSLNRLCRHKLEKAIQPWLFEKTPGTSEPIPHGRMPLINSDNAFCLGAHGTRTIAQSAAAHSCTLLPPFPPRPTCDTESFP